MTATPQLYALCAGADGCFPPPRREAEAGRGLVGALLVQGALADRLELHRDRVRPTGRGPSGDPVLDAFLARLEASPRERAPADWAQGLDSWALGALRSGSRPPGPAVPGHRPGALRQEALRRVRTAIREPDAADVAAVAAGALLVASGLHRYALPGLSRSAASRSGGRAVDALRAAGLPVALASSAVSASLRSSAAALAFPG